MNPTTTSAPTVTSRESDASTPTCTPHEGHGLCLSRRRFLEGTASVAGIGVLAACSTGGGDPAPASPSAGAGGGGGEEGASLVALADVPVGGAVAATTAAGDPIIVAQPEEGTVVAFSAVCTHQGCTVEPDGAELSCPCHGSVFEAATGANVSGPAPRPLDPVTVTVSDGQVLEG